MVGRLYSHMRGGKSLDSLSGKLNYQMGLDEKHQITQET